MKLRLLILSFATSMTVLFPLPSRGGELNTTIRNDAATSSNATANPSSNANSSATASPTLSNGSASSSDTVNVLQGPTNNNNNSQVNAANAQSAPAANINSTQINNNSIGSYKIGDAVCSTTTLSINGYGGLNNGNLLSENTNYGASVSLQIPLAGRVGSACSELAAATAKKMELTNTISLISTCIDWKRAGVKLTNAAPQELRVACSYIQLENPPIPTTAADSKR